MPTGPEATKSAFDVHQYSGFPNIAPYFADGTAIKCHVPKYLDRACYNRKQYHSLNALFVVGNRILKNIYYFQILYVLSCRTTKIATETVSHPKSLAQFY